MNNNISINDLLKLDNINIIDIRNRNSYVSGHIPQAVNIDEYDLLFNTVNYLDKNKKYYLYCDSGSRSEQLVYRLNSRGYNTVNIVGGYHNYLLRK